MPNQRATSEPYLLGHSPEAIQRLVKMGRLLSPFTERLLVDAGITKGMRVLDVGCGPGSVSLLAAKLVGPEGSVLGVDTNGGALQLAEARARDAGVGHVAFRVADLRDLTLDAKFDAIIGRLILQHLPEPAAVLRRLTSQLRRGGVVAFQEFDLSSHADASYPPSALWQQMWTWVTRAFEYAGVETGMGMKLYGTFRDAGLPAPQLRYETSLGSGPDWDGYDVWAETIRPLAPVLERAGVATAEEIGLETLADRLRADTVGSGGVARGPVLISAWTRIA
jgi:SAM-dependent methyltransferase